MMQASCQQLSNIKYDETMTNTVHHSGFSKKLETWLKGNQHKTLASLIDVFEDKSFAIVFLVLMLLPALPIPTGGLTHLLELVVALLALEMIIGLKTIWLPKSWKKRRLGKTMEGKIVPLILRRVRWFEERSRTRWKWIFTAPLAERLLGLVVLIFTIFAFVSPPFSGLDTLPSLGVVIISLAIILDDALMLLAGLLVGVVGSALVIGLGAAAFEGVTRIF